MAATDINQHTQTIKAEAQRLGFDLCGIAHLERVNETDCRHYDRWIKEGYNASMGYMANHREVRFDPTWLLPGAKSIVMVGMNYYPHTRQPAHLPQVSVYAYGKDYHTVMKQRLEVLMQQVNQLDEGTHSRCFVDAVPLFERYWAMKAGLGWIGKNRQLITRRGSFFFLGEVITTLTLEADSPMKAMCGRCERCLSACPGQALSTQRGLNANRCISYRTIEHKGEWPMNPTISHGNRLMGCDVCQDVCPWNRFALPTPHEAFHLTKPLSSFTIEAVEEMTPADFSSQFKDSPLKRLKLEGMKRNARTIKTW